MADRALGLAVGLLVDRALGEPPTTWHPVAWFGTTMTRLEQRLYADSRAAGLTYALAGAGLGALTGVGLRSVCGRLEAVLPRPVTASPQRPAWTTVTSVALAVSVASAGRMLRRTATSISELLADDESREQPGLAAARERLPWLVGRDPSGLDESGIAAAVVESLAENTVDAVIAPAFWALVGGAPGALAHRAVNTMDAMVGHRNQRYTHFGWAAARADDVMAWVPARIFAGLVAVLATGSDRGAARSISEGEARPQPTGASRVLRTVCRDAPAHPSPNAGVAEAAVAGALGVQLGGPLRYGERVERRPILGSGPRPAPADIDRARRLVDRVELLVVAGAVAVWWVERRTRRT